MLPETTSKVASNAITKGDVFGAARIAGIQAAKRTADMIPLCHPLLVGAVNINFTLGDDYVEVESRSRHRPDRRRDGGDDRLRVAASRSTTCASPPTGRWSSASWPSGRRSGGGVGHWRRPGATSRAAGQHPRAAPGGQLDDSDGSTETVGRNQSPLGSRPARRTPEGQVGPFSPIGVRTGRLGYKKPILNVR